MNLSDRKKKILQIVVDNYIATAQPVSSKLITEKYMPDVSSATVRGELATLEELGFLEQPHTSSGRVPSVEAYKLYVEELMDKGKLTKNELQILRDNFNRNTDNIEQVLEGTVKVISQLTNYTSVAYNTHSENDKVVRVNIFRHKKKQALFIIATENSLVRDKFIDIPEDLTDSELNYIDSFVNKIFDGKTFKEILNLELKILEEFKAYRKIFESIMSTIEQYVTNENCEFLLEGEEKIMNQHEFSSDPSKIKEFITAVKSKEKVVSMLENADIDINVKLGNGDGVIPEDCSLVSATYLFGGHNYGTYGVIGPSRMDYKKVYAVFETIGKMLSDIIKENGEDND